MKHKKVIPILILFWFIIGPSNLHAQNLESVVDSIKNFKAKSIKIHGGIRLANTYYAASGINPRRDLFQWLMHANLNISVGGFSIPFSATFSEGNKEFNLPSFLFAGLSPTYKWATVHVGDRVMNFSKYSLSNHNFFGGGVELNPGNFRFGAMYGRLKRAVAEDLVNLQAIDPSYRRMGTGFNTGFDDGNNKLMLSVFKAWDDETSIPIVPQETEVLPADNAIISLTGRKAIGKSLSFSGEFARSAYNRDMRSAPVPNNEKTAFNQVFGLFKPTTSAVYANAYNLKGNYRIKKTNFGLAYERIDPGYITMGSLYFDNDIERYTANMMTRLYKDKVSLSVNGGIERNDLDGEELTTNLRGIGSVNLGYRHNDRLNFSLSYSNFRNTTKLKSFNDPFNVVDSIFLAQVSQNINFITTYQLTPGNESKTSSITGIFSYQNASSIENDIVTNDPTQFYNSNLIYTYGVNDIGLSTTAAFSLTAGKVQSISNLALSPTLAVQKTFLEEKNLRTSLSVSYSKVYANSNPVSQVFNTGLGITYSFLKGHNVGWQNSFTWRSANSGSGVTNFNEFTGVLQYSYQF